jgi:hypothetical protein
LSQTAWPSSKNNVILTPVDIIQPPTWQVTPLKLAPAAWHEDTAAGATTAALVGGVLQAFLCGNNRWCVVMAIASTWCKQRIVAQFIVLT